MKLDFPLHKFNMPAYQAWVKGGGVAQRAMARALNTLYPGKRVGVICPQPMHLIAVVSPSGRVQTLTRPYRTVQFWQLANAPAVENCNCQDFTDPENGYKPWRERGSGRHHPLCQYDEASAETFAVLQAKGKPHERPDGWTQVNDKVREKRGLSTHQKVISTVGNCS